MDDLKEYYPSGKLQVLERRDQIVYKYIKMRCTRNELLSARDIYGMIKGTGVDEELTNEGFSRITVRGRKDVTSMISVLNNLWWAGKMCKFARGIYEISGRQYGVMWLIEDD